MIWYGCDHCHEQDVEHNVRTDTRELFISPNNTWLCEECFNDMHPEVDIRKALNPVSPLVELKQIKQRLKDEGMVI
jgi:hypothetical protein